MTEYSGIIFLFVVGSLMIRGGWAAIEKPELSGVRLIGEIDPDSEVSEGEAWASKLFGGILILSGCACYFLVFIDIWYRIR